MGSGRSRKDLFARRALQGACSPTADLMDLGRGDDGLVGSISKPGFRRPPRGQRRRLAPPLGRGQVNRR
jgi:hypothetical protein